MEKLRKIRQRTTVTNYKNENRMEYITAYVNPLSIKYCLEFGDVVRICFSESDYIEVDRVEFEDTFASE